MVGRISFWVLVAYSLVVGAAMFWYRPTTTWVIMTLFVVQAILAGWSLVHMIAHWRSALMNGWEYRVRDLRHCDPTDPRRTFTAPMGGVSVSFQEAARPQGLRWRLGAVLVHCGVFLLLCIVYWSTLVDVLGNLFDRVDIAAARTAVNAKIENVKKDAEENRKERVALTTLREEITAKVHADMKEQIEKAKEKSEAMVKDAERVAKLKGATIEAEMERERAKLKKEREEFDLLRKGEVVRIDKEPLRWLVSQATRMGVHAVIAPNGKNFRMVVSATRYEAPPKLRARIEEEAKKDGKTVRNLGDICLMSADGKVIRSILVKYKDARNEDAAVLLEGLDSDDKADKKTSWWAWKLGKSFKIAADGAGLADSPPIDAPLPPKPEEIESDLLPTVKP